MKRLAAGVAFAIRRMHQAQAASEDVAVDAQLEKEVRGDAHATLRTRARADEVVAAGVVAVAGAHRGRVGVLEDAGVEGLAARAVRGSPGPSTASWPAVTLARAGPSSASPSKT